LDLSFNRLRTLPEDFFSKNQQIFKLIFRNNQLGLLPKNIFRVRVVIPASSADFNINLLLGSFKVKRTGFE